MRITEQRKEKTMKKIRYNKDEEIKQNKNEDNR